MLVSVQCLRSDSGSIYRRCIFAGVFEELGRVGFEGGVAVSPGSEFSIFVSPQNIVFASPDAEDDFHASSFGGRKESTRYIAERSR